MRKTLIILTILLALLPVSNAGAQDNRALADIVDSLPPYIRVTIGNAPLPVITDEDLLKNGIVVRFKVNRTNISPYDPGYMELVKALKRIPGKFKYSHLLVMRGSASPEGPAKNNERLAHNRARALADSLRRYVSIADSTIEERYINEDYAGLRTIVVGSNIPYKEEILGIIDNSTDDATTKRRLQALDHGRVWKRLLRDYYPRLRATRVIIIVGRDPALPPEPVETVQVVPMDKHVRVIIPPIEPPIIRPIDIPREQEYVFKPWIAIKTNMLYDAVMTPNVEIERWFGKRNQWSIMAEWNFPWWQWHQKARVYEVNEFGLELRRWLFRGVCADEQTYVRDAKTGKLKRKYPDSQWWLNGHFVGIYLAGGYYDLEWRYHGEQGDIYSAGLTYGYAINLSRHWNLEFSASIGFIHSPYYHHEAELHDDILFAKYKKQFNYFGPTKLKISIAWLIGRTKKKK